MLSRGASRDQVLTIGPELLDLDIDPPEPSADERSRVSTVDPVPPSPPPLETIRALRDSVEICQRRAIGEALAATRGNWAQAARALGLDPSNLHKLARRLGMKHEPGSLP